MLRAFDAEWSDDNPAVGGTGFVLGLGRANRGGNGNRRGPVHGRKPAGFRRGDPALRTRADFLVDAEKQRLKDKADAEKQRLKEKADEEKRRAEEKARQKMLKIEAANSF